MVETSSATDNDRSSRAGSSSRSDRTSMNDTGDATGRGMDAAKARDALNTPETRGVLADSARSIGNTPQRDVASEIAVDAAQAVSKAAVGYRADMYGEIGVGNRTADIAGKRQFGGPVRGTTLADAQYTARQGSGGAPSYGIDDFAKTNKRGEFARNAIVSSHAAVTDSRATVAARPDLSPADVSFEINRPGTTRTRFDDATIRSATPGAPPDIKEYKAAKSLSSSQMPQDIRSASGLNARNIEIVVTDNPNTGAQGLTPSEQAKAARAQASTNGNLTTRYAPDIAPSKASLEALETAAKVSRGARVFGKVAAPIGVAADVYAIGSAYRADGNQIGTNTKVAVAETAGGWAGAGAGAVGGAKVGAAVGTVIGGPIGTAVGAVAGGLIGAVGGALVGSGVLGSLAKGWFS